jgi:excisionase family DNA binding protein
MVNEDTTLTPPELAKRWGVAADKVLDLIHSGQLKAVNLAVNPNGRPRYRIYASEVERFETARSTKPPVPKQRRRRRGTTSGKQYF